MSTSLTASGFLDLREYHGGSRWSGNAALENLDYMS